MQDSTLTKMYQTQISLTEWFENIGHKDTAAMRQEDNEKRDRLRVLHELIGLPFDEPYVFAASEVKANTPLFQKFVAEHGDELCALRLIPKNPAFPKFRMRGFSVRDVLDWFDEQRIDPSMYQADFVPHPSDHVWSTIFVVNTHGIFGEIIAGGHHQLTQGFADHGKPITFSYQFFGGQKQWKLEPFDAGAKKHLEEIAGFLHVQDAGIRKKLGDALQAQWASDFLYGYFETVSSSEFGLWFIDYNRLLGDVYKDFRVDVSLPDSSGFLKGQSGSSGKAQGKVRRVIDPLHDFFEEGEVLVCEMTTPSYVPLMKKAAAIVTDRGGILSHASVIARELHKPCVVGTSTATQKLREGSVIEVDADRGVISFLQ